MIKANVLFSCVLSSVLFIVSNAHADTCNYTCSEGTGDYWPFSNIGGGNDQVMVGMIYIPFFSSWMPVACEGGTIYYDGNSHLYASRQLSADTTVCLGGGNDVFEIATDPDGDDCGGTPIFPFDGGAYEFTVGGDSGDDYIQIDGLYDGETNLCGHNGNDQIDAQASTGHNYISGQAGNDYIVGGRGNDSYRGYTGNDWWVHLSDFGTDSIKGYTDDDCSKVYGSVTGTSSCEEDDTNDRYFSGTTQLDSCELVISNCCDLSGTQAGCSE